MKRRAKTAMESQKVTFEVLAGRRGGEGIFGIEDEADELARQAKLQRRAERIAGYDRGYEGKQRRCPRCGQVQRYKGDASRELVVDGGRLTVQRAYYFCPACGQASYPLDEKLGLSEEQEQGRLREKLALVAVLGPYHQAPQVCHTLLGSERHASSLRRGALREAQRLAASGHRHTLPQRQHDRLYLQVDGQMCPTREERQSAQDQGYREAKAIVAFSHHDVAEVSKERHEILHKILKAKVTDCEDFRPLVQEVYRQARGQNAAEVIVLADGARWIWTLVEDVVPHAIQILDFSHAKHYLWEAGKLIYGEGSALVAPWVKAREALLLQDKGEQVIAPLQHFLDLRPELAPIIHYFHQNAARMRYGTYRQRGYFIGSGAIESAGKQITTARIKGAGMRWNIQDLNALLTLRCVFLEHSWSAYWESQARLVA
jgi:ribosomal protein S27AE